MRRAAHSSIVVMLAASVLALAGCKNNGVTFTNPFLTADKVPPPPTRVLAPGTAQPYYPGDPMPGAAAAGAATFGAPATGVAPGAGYAPGTTYAPASTSPGTTPPGGWGGYGPQSSAAPAGPRNGDAVNVPGDPQGLRFAAAESASAGPARLTQREVTAAEYFAPPPTSFATAGGPLASAAGSRDGFRPLGSAASGRTDDAAGAPSAFRPPSIRGAAAAAAGTEDGTRFAAGENYETLRGQLEYWPATGAWSLRYVPEGGSADALGGRVVIDNPQVLANLQPGEMVTVRGQAYSKSTEDGGVQPAYRVSAVQRQRM